ncbi:MAG: PD40 domain-containing protein [Candidatus Coatesbacteria bacterium]|nr:MAG: PD40 domain-containing protein [Candidatus Coatesbacteria bacterium]
MVKVNKYARVLLFFGLFAAAVSCEDVPTSTLPGPYVPPPVKGDDGRRLLWEPKPGEKQCFEPSFSPDGMKVVVSYRYGIFAPAADLAILDLKTGKIKVIVEGNVAKRPAWSPTGEWIAYQSDAGVGRYIWLCRPDGSENHRLEFKNAFTPRWGPEGDKIYFPYVYNAREKDYGVYYDLNEEKLNILYRDPLRHVGVIIPSPGGKKVAFYLLDNIHNGNDINLALINPDGTRFEVIWPAGPHRVWAAARAWSPNGRYILMGYGYPGNGTGELGTYEPKTGIFNPLTMCPPRLELETIRYASWGPNGDIVFDNHLGRLFLIKAPE